MCLLNYSFYHLLYHLLYLQLFHPRHRSARRGRWTPIHTQESPLSTTHLVSMTIFKAHDVGKSSRNKCSIVVMATTGGSPLLDVLTVLPFVPPLPRLVVCAAVSCGERPTSSPSPIFHLSVSVGKGRLRWLFLLAAFLPTL